MILYTEQIGNLRGEIQGASYGLLSCYEYVIREDIPPSKGHKRPPIIARSYTGIIDYNDCLKRLHERLEAILELDEFQTITGKTIKPNRAAPSQPSLF